MGAGTEEGSGPNGPGHPCPPGAPVTATVPNTARGAVPFAQRHIGPNDADIATMLGAVGYGSLHDLVSAAVPAIIQWRDDLMEGKILLRDVVDLEATMGGEYKVTEKAAKAHALKVARDSFTPPKPDN